MSLPTEKKTEHQTLILGIGNTLCGDDGAGIRVAEMLENCRLPSTIRVMKAGLPGWGLPSWFEDWEKVILIDALEMGEKPGTWRQFELRPISLGL
jgi:hydrogenase maturation protease